MRDKPVTKKKAIRTGVGLWIDHRKAIVVAVTEEGEELGLVISNVEKQPRRSGESPLKGRFETRRVAADDIRQRVFTGRLNIYYDAVIACLGDAESILIFGPGEAKGELEKRLARGGLGGRIINVETVDKMTRPQIAAKVRKHFAGKGPARGSRPHDRTRSAGGRGQARPPKSR